MAEIQPEPTANPRSPLAPGDSPPRLAAHVFVLVTIFFDTLSLGIIIPVLPNLVKDLTQGDTAKAVQIYGLFGTIYGLMQFVFSPLLGALSDRFGRRPVILISNFGLGLDYLLMAVAPTIEWLFLGRLVSGITAASVPTAMAYITDVTPPQRRVGAFGMINAAFGLGFILGPGIGGILGGLSPRAPFWVAGAFSLANALYGLVVLPESLPSERRSPFTWRRASHLGSVQLLRSHHELLGLAGVIFLCAVAHESLPNTFALFAGHRFDWGEGRVGMALVVMGVCSAVVQIFITKPFVARYGERATMVTGLMLGSVGFLIYGLAPLSAIFWTGIPFIALWGLSGPAVQGIMARHVSPGDQGKLQGAGTSLRSLASVLAPSCFAVLFATFLRNQWRPVGIVFVLAGLLVLAAGLVGLLATRASAEVMQPGGSRPLDPEEPVIST